MFVDTRRSIMRNVLCGVLASLSSVACLAQGNLRAEAVLPNELRCPLTVLNMRSYSDSAFAKARIQIQFAGCTPFLAYTKAEWLSAFTEPKNSAYSSEPKMASRADFICKLVGPEFRAYGGVGFEKIDCPTTGGAKDLDCLLFSKTAYDSRPGRLILRSSARMDDLIVFTYVNCVRD